MNEYMLCAVEKYSLDKNLSNWDKLKKQSHVYHKGELIAFEPMKSVFFLVSGTIKPYFISDDGSAFLFSENSSYFVFGELEFLNLEPLNCQFEAITDVISVEIPFDDNRAYLEDDLSFYKFISNELGKRLIQISSSFVHKEIYPLKTRLASYLVNNYKQSDEIKNLKSISTTLNCSYRQLLRILTEFCDKGFLKRGDKKGTYILIEFRLLKVEELFNENSVI